MRASVKAARGGEDAREDDDAIASTRTRWHAEKNGLVCAVKCSEKATTKMEEYDEEEA